MEEVDDRRGSGRVHIMTSVTLQFGGQEVEATAMDLSESGISVWAPKGAKPEGLMSIAMVIDDHGPMMLSGRLAREFESDGGSVWGIAFEDVDPAKQARIIAYVEMLG